MIQDVDKFNYQYTVQLFWITWSQKTGDSGPTTEYFLYFDRFTGHK